MDKRFNIEVIYRGKAETGHVMAASYYDAVFKLTYFCGFKRKDILRCEEAIDKPTEEEGKL